MRRSPEALLYFLVALSLVSACSGLPKSQRPEPSAPALPAESPRPAQTPAPAAPKVSSHAPKSFPAPKTILLDHRYFKVYYDPELRLPRVVVYTLTAEHLRVATKKRRDRFRADPMLVEEHRPFVDKKEYVRSGYDKGHMAPFKDFAWSEEGGEETFIMSNMVPQKPKLNQQAWEDLEENVRRWACGEEKITVLTGPIIDADLPTLKSGLPIPRRFYKILIDETPPKKTVGFIYEQSDDRKGLTRNRVVRVDEIEKDTHLEFGKIASSWEPSETRAPASLNDWKSEDCVGRGSLRRIGGDAEDRDR